MKPSGTNDQVCRYDKAAYQEPSRRTSSVFVMEDGAASVKRLSARAGV